MGRLDRSLPLPAPPMSRFRLPLAAALALVLGVAAAPRPDLPPDVRATIETLQMGLTNIPADAAVENIEGWRDALAGNSNPYARAVHRDLGMLRSELTSGDIDGEMVGLYLVRMGTYTKVLGEGNADLTQLGDILVGAGFMLR